LVWQHLSLPCALCHAQAETPRSLFRLARVDVPPGSTENERTDAESHAEQHDRCQVIVDNGNRAKEVTARDERHDPEGCASHDAYDESGELHFCDAAYERRESPYDRDIGRQQESYAAMMLIESTSLV
jgi:hypothetical protein